MRSARVGSTFYVCPFARKIKNILRKTCSGCRINWSMKVLPCLFYHSPQTCTSGHLKWAETNSAYRATMPCLPPHLFPINYQCTKGRCIAMRDVEKVNMWMWRGWLLLPSTFKFLRFTDRFFKSSHLLFLLTSEKISAGCFFLNEKRKLENYSRKVPSEAALDGCYYGNNDMWILRFR